MSATAARSGLLAPQPGLAAHQLDQLVVAEVAREGIRHRAAVPHHDGPHAVLEHLGQAVGDEDRGEALGCLPRRVLEQLTGRPGVERGGGLVQDDEPERLVGDREGAGDLDHLAQADRQLAHRLVEVDAVAGKDLVEHAADQRRRPSPPAEAPERRVHQAEILDHRQVGAEREFLEYAADAPRIGDAHVVAAGEIRPVDLDRALVRRQRAGEDVHQRRLAGAVVPDEAQDLAGPDLEVGGPERLHRAEPLGDAVQCYERRALARRRDTFEHPLPAQLALGAGEAGRGLPSALALISSLVQSWV